MMCEACFNSKDGRILDVFENLSENLRRSETWMKNSLAEGLGRADVDLNNLRYLQ